MAREFCSQLYEQIRANSRIHSTHDSTNRVGHGSTFQGNAATFKIKIPDTMWAKKPQNNSNHFIAGHAAMVSSLGLREG